MQSALVRNALLSLSYRHRQEELDHDYPSVLALLTYSPIGLEEGLQSLDKLRKEKVRLRLWIDETLDEIYSMAELIRNTGVDDIVRPRHRHPDGLSCTYLFIPVLSPSLVSSVLLFDDRHPFSRVIMEGLLKGRKVAAIPIGSEPYHPLWKQRGFDQASPLLKHEMKSSLLKLRGYGVELLDPENATDWVKREQRTAGRRVLSQEDILQACANGTKVIRIEPNTIITPLAMDLATQHGIEIMRGHGLV